MSHRLDLDKNVVHFNKLTSAYRLRRGSKASFGSTNSAVFLNHIEDEHLVGSSSITVVVNDPADSGGVTDYTNHKIWPDLDATLDSYTATLNVVKSLSRQWSLGDCWLLSGINAIIEKDYSIIKSRIVALPSGQIGVYCFLGGDVNKPVTLVFDYMLGNNGVKLPPDGCIAYKAAENAMAFGRYMYLNSSGQVVSDSDLYSTLDGGWMTEVYNFFGIPAISALIPSDGLAMVATFAAYAADPKSATAFGTSTVTTSGWISNHAYSVTSHAEAVNPWGVNYSPMVRPILATDRSSLGTSFTVADLSKAFPVPNPVVPIPAPQITSFNVSPPSITQGGLVALTANVLGVVDSVIFSRDTTVNAAFDATDQVLGIACNAQVWVSIREHCINNRKHHISVSATVGVPA